MRLTGTDGQTENQIGGSQATVGKQAEQDSLLLKKDPERSGKGDFLDFKDSHTHHDNAIHPEQEPGLENMAPQVNEKGK